jgi:hypothetical protein
MSDKETEIDSLYEYNRTDVKITQKLFKSLPKIKPDIAVIEVRCCCLPNKLLGWIDVKEPLVRGQIYTFPYTETVEATFCGAEIVPISKGYSVGLQLERITVNEEKYLAFKSEETPLETLRKLPNFTENKKAQRT